MKVLLIAALLLFATPVLAEDPCANRNPRYCQSNYQAPIIVEKVRVMPEGSIATTHDTIVRQGDRVLMVIKGKSNQTSIDHKTRRDLGYE